MLYNIFIDKEQVGLGLSSGELNQWLIELNRELSIESSKLFMSDLGLNNKDISFEEFLYSVKFTNLPISVRFNNEILKIKEYDF